MKNRPVYQIKRIFLWKLSLVLIFSIGGSQLAKADHGESNTSPLYDSIQPFCGLFSNSKGNTIVRTRAVLYLQNGSTDPYFYSPDCNNREFIALARFAEDFNFAEYSLDSAEHEYFMVEFRASFESRVLASFGKLGWARALFDVKEIVSVSPIEKGIVEADFKAPAPILELGREFIFLYDMKVLVGYFRGFEQNKEFLSKIVPEKTAILEINHSRLSAEEYFSKRHPERITTSLISNGFSGSNWFSRSRVLNRRESGRHECVEFYTEYEMVRRAIGD